MSLVEPPRQTAYLARIHPMNAPGSDFDLRIYPAHAQLSQTFFLIHPMIAPGSDFYLRIYPAPAQLSQTFFLIGTG